MSKREMQWCDWAAAEIQGLREREEQAQPICCAALDIRYYLEGEASKGNCRARALVGTDVAETLQKLRDWLPSVLPERR